MLNEPELLRIHQFIKNGFGEDIAQEVALRLLLKDSKGEAVNDWHNYGFVTAKHIHWHNCREEKRLVSLSEARLTRIKYWQEQATTKDALENQIIARQQLALIPKDENSRKVIRYSLYGKLTTSRQYIEQIRSGKRGKLREVLK